jgi:hypothetical protein
MSAGSANEDVASFSIMGLTVWAVWRDAVPKVWVIAKKFLELEVVVSEYVSVTMNSVCCGGLTGRTHQL